MCRGRAVAFDMDVRRLAVARGNAPAAGGWAVGSRPIIVSNPREDAAFRFLVGILLLHGVVSAGDLQSKLRATYPNVVVRPRELTGEAFEVWYAYREGHWIGSEGDGET